MEALGIHLSPFFEWLLKTTIQASVLICLILFVKLVLRHKLPIRWHYYLWILLLIRLALPWSPQSKISIFNLMPQSGSLQKIEAVNIIDEGSEGIVQSDGGISDNRQSEPASVQTDSVGAAGSESFSETATSTIDNVPPVVIQPSRSQTTNLSDILPLIWLAGALALAGYILLRNIILWRAIKSERQVTDQQLLELLEDCKMQMRIHTVVGVVVTDKVKSPALFGFVRPRLLLPQGLLEELDLDELQYVFLHELAHLRRNDIYFGWIVSLLQVLHWFNPLIWFAFRRMRTDQELACDALALSTMSSEEPQQYGRTLVNLFERFSQVNYVPSIAGILEDKSQLERRIKMITKYNKSSYRWSPLAAILIIILGCVTLPNAISTKASQILAAESPPPISLRRIWAGPEVDIEGAPSPDGRYISYVDLNTSGDLAIYEIATGEKRRLTNKGTWDESNEFALFSRWSPDGKQIVYDWYNKDDFCELRIIGLDDSKPRILYRNKEVLWAQTYDWSPDGKQILACFNRKDGAGNDVDQIVLISVEDGSVRVLKTFKTLGSYSSHHMSFSPDGRYIVYDFPQGENSSERDISLLSIDDHREVPLVEHPADDRVLGWMPDGKNILFISDRTGNYDVWSLQVDGEKHQGDPILVKQSIGKRFIPMGFTKDGSLYFGCRGDVASDIYVTTFDSDSGEILVPPKKIIKHFEGNNRSPVYSPDGKYLAYVSIRSNIPSTFASVPNVLCISSLETGQVREISMKLQRISLPRWSPDGKSIIVTGNDYSGRGIYLIDSQTGTFKPILPPPQDNLLNTHEWSANGKAIYIVRRSTKEKLSRIILREIESGTEKELYRSSYSDYPDSFRLSSSPDGKWLAFIKREKATLMIMPAAGGEPRELYSFDQENEIVTLRWTPDSKYILFVTRQQEPEECSLWRIAKEGGESQKLELNAQIHDLSIHPDGQQIAFHTMANEPSEVWVMENFLPGSDIEKTEDIVIRKIMDASGAGDHGGGEPSPDGKYFCFVDWETNEDIVIKEIGTGEEIRLRKRIDLNYEGDTGTPYFPTWSPDSKKIAYTWESDEGQYIELRVIEIDNPEPDVLIRVNYFKGWVTAVDWSPDGQHILVLRSENDQDQLGLISIEDSSFRPLKKFVDSVPDAAKFSLDGHHIAYDLPPNKENTNHDIYVLSIDGRRQVKLTSHPSHDYLLDWSPTGKKILFASDRTGTMDMWSISFDEGAPQGEPKLITENIGLIRPLGCTRNGSFYFSTPGSWWDIYTVTIDPKTGKITEPPTEVPLPYQGYNKHPEWSPNGEYLTYISMRGHLRPERRDILCVYSIETGAVKEVDYKGDIDDYSWSLDSQSILANVDNEILKIHAKTGEIEKIDLSSYKQSVYSPSISPDNKYFYYVKGDEKSGIKSVIRRDLKTEKKKELYRTPDDSITTALSPDGKQLALLSRHKENTRILKILSTMNGSEKDIHKFKLKKYGYISIAWSPDGRYIYFYKRNDSEDKSELCRIPAAGGTAENLGVKMHGFVNISIHPDGRRITFASLVGFDKPGGIWVMENFLPEEILAAQR